MSTIEKAMAKKGKLEGVAKVEKVEPMTLPEQNASSVSEFSKPNDRNMAAKSQSQDRVFSIDSARLKELGMISDSTSLKERLVRDEFRVIKHKLLKNAFGSNGSGVSKKNLVMVSSAKPNEGKTFISINLALSIASEQDKTVLLIDADVLSSSVDDVLGLESRDGLIDYLSGDIEDVGDIIYPTTIPDLRIMPAGNAHLMSYELLSSDRMLALMEELANRYPDRIIVVDCPPLLGVVETVTLFNLIGQAVIVVEQNKTKVSEVKQAI